MMKKKLIEKMSEMKANERMDNVDEQRHEKTTRTKEKTDEDEILFHFIVVSFFSPVETNAKNQ